MDTNQINEEQKELNINEQAQTPTEPQQEAATPVVEEAPVVEESPVVEETLTAEETKNSDNQIEETTVLEPLDDTGDDKSGADALDNYAKAEKKGLKIAILVILLVLDIAVLVIYLIGIDKVLSFIK